jgi:outer membrane protein assembly factor BamB
MIARVLGRLALIVAAGLTTSCDSLLGEANPELPVWLHRPGGALSIAFRRNITDKNRVRGEAYERGRPEIDAEHHRVFVPSADRGLYAIDARNGSTIWRFETLGVVQSEPLYVPEEDALYFGSGDGALYKVRADNGVLLWRFATNGEVSRAPVLSEDTVFITNANDTLIAIDKKTGKLKWHQHRTPAYGIEVAGYAGPAIAGDKVYAAFSDGIVMAYSQKDGSEQWPEIDLAIAAPGATEGRPPQYLDIDTTPIVTEAKGAKVIVVASYEAGLFALDAVTGREVWHNAETRGVTNLLLWDEPPHEPKIAPPEASRVREDGSIRKLPLTPPKRLLIGSSGPTGLWAIDAETGEAVWRNRLPQGGISGAARVSGALLVTTTRYGIFLFSPRGGKLIDGVAPGWEFSQTPAALGTKAYVMSNGGELVSLVVQPPPR